MLPESKYLLFGEGLAGRAGLDDILQETSACY
jgi:hypothetical protein